MVGDRNNRVVEIASALSNPTRLQIVTSLAEGPKTTQELHEEIGDLKYRDSTYRHAEELFEVGIVNKEYDPDEKEMRYSLKHRSVTFMFSDEGINFDFEAGEDV